MPRDDTSGPSSAAVDPKAPLKRGDACLYCRKRRIRCSAEKPSCQHCTKLQRECVYDNGKPVSRVKQLEEKVAELEEYLKAGSAGSVMHALSKAGGSSATQGQQQPPPPLVHHSSSGTSTSSGGLYANPAYGLTGSYEQARQPTQQQSQQLYPGAGQAQNAMSFESFAFTGSTFGPTLGQEQHPNQFSQYQQQQDLVASMGNVYGPTMGSSKVDPVAVDDFDFSTLDPSFMALINSLGAASTGEAMEGMNAGMAQGMGMASGSGLQQQQQMAQAMGQGQGASSGNAMAGSSGGMDVDAQYTSGLTPFLDPTNGQGLGAAPPMPASTTQPTMSSMSSLSTGQSFSNSVSPNSMYGAQPDPAACNAPQPISIQPYQQAERVSYHAFVSSVPEASPEKEYSHSEAQNINANVRENVIGVSGSNPNFSSANGKPPPGKEARLGEGWVPWMKDQPVPAELLDADSRGLVGGWFDPTDLPRVARDHLLDLFFSGMRMYGQEFHIPRFFASLSLPAAKRPHPCLLYTMYLLASRSSTSQPIRSLEKHFYNIAMEKLDEAIVAADRLFDAVRAATLLAVYKYSLAKYHEAWMMSGQASRLALSCGLHAIPSSVFKSSQIPTDHRADLIGLMRQRSWVLPPPMDAIALGERIWAFWAVYTVDRCGSIATQWPPSIHDSDVITPYARPLAEYELGLVNDADDVSVGSVYDSEPPAPLPPYAESTYVNLRMRAICILERASKLMYLKPEPGWQEPASRSNSTSTGASPATAAGSGSSVSPPTWGTWGDDMISNDQYINIIGGMAPDSRRGGTSEHKGWSRTARVRTPKAYGEVLMALKRIEADLPEERRTCWEEWDGNVQDWHFGGSNRREAFVLHFLLGCSWMFLFDVFSFNAPNDLAVGVARRLVFTIRAVMNDQLGSDLDVFIAMTWSFVVKVIIREVKRLHSIGEHKAAKPLENEVEIIVQALQIFGKRYSIATFQAKRADQFRKATAEDTKFMEEKRTGARDGRNGNGGGDSEEEEEEWAQMPNTPPGYES